MIEGFEIRPFHEDDLEAVVTIQEAIIQRNVAPGWLNMIRIHLDKPKGINLVAVLDGKVIGFFNGAVKHGDFGLENSGWVETFGVSPKYMGQGVGRALALSALERFKELGINEIYTTVRWDSGDLLAFFKKIGFTLSDFINLKASLD